MKYKIEPWPHQRATIEHVLSLPDDPIFPPGYALFWVMGVGKSGATINILRGLFNRKSTVLRTLIFCPPIVVPNWREEWLKHSSIDPRSVICLQGSETQRVKDFMRPEGRVFITNYEALRMKRLGGTFDEKNHKYTPGLFAQWSPEALVWDECHYLKDPRRDRSRLARMLSNPLGQNHPYKYLLSGTPVLASPMDLFHQFLVLDNGKTLGQNFFTFRARFFRDRNVGMPKARYFPKWEPMTLEKDGRDGVAEINALISGSASRIEKKDALDLPPELEVPISVPLSKEQARVYEDMRQDLIAYIDSQACVARLALTKMLRLMQITSGFLPVEAREEGGEQVLKSLGKTPRREALTSLLADLTPHSKVIVWAAWRENYAQIREVCQELGVKYLELHGEARGGGAFDTVAAFTNDPDIRVLISNPRSGGIGINIVCAPYDIWYSYTYSLADYLQAKARNHRAGQTEKVTHYFLQAQNTIDCTVLNRLANKVQMSEKLLRDLGAELRAQA